MGGGDEGKSWHHYFTDEGEGFPHHLQAQGGVTDRYAVVDAYQLGDSALELLHHWAVVRKPSSAKHLAQMADESSTAADVGSAHVQGLGKGRRASEQGEIVDTTFASERGT
jgi:hypothetical protein